MLHRISNLKQSIYEINMMARKVFVWLINLCYNYRAFIVPLLEILLLGYILVIGYSKMPKFVEKKFANIKGASTLWVAFFTLILAAILYVLSS